MSTEPVFQLLVEKDVPIPVGDGNVLRANVYRPAAEGRFPVVMAHGVYGKDIHFADGYRPQWDNLLKLHPDLCRNGSSGRYLRWEIVDPERWVPDGYVIIQVDARGTGKSPGYLDPRSAREMQDFYEAIEWAGTQSWSNGKVGLCGISYYAFTQWAVAALRPPHLAAICPWEGFVDYYRDSTHHGGIFANTFSNAWWPRQVLVNQYGNAATPHHDRDTGERTTGGPALSEAMLAGNRADYTAELLRHSLDDAWYDEHTPDLSRIKVPLLSAGNWSGPGVHLRGNIEGYLGAASRDKWLSMHVGTHFESFYLPEYVAMQKRFFDHFLKGVENGWEREPRVQLSIRRPDGSHRRMEDEFPLRRTQWTRFHLDASGRRIARENPATAAQLSYDAMGDGVDFSTPPFLEETEICGFVTLRLWISSSTTDTDIFATLRLFGPDDREVTFVGAHETVSLTKGWLRASHRKLDVERTLPFRVFHTHDEVQKLTPGEFYPVDVEILPTSMVFPSGYRLVLTLQGHDFEFPGIPGRILHNHPRDRDPAEFAGRHTIATGGQRECYLLMPVIPAS
jgi:hypothetical protein